MTFGNAADKCLHCSQRQPRDIAGAAVEVFLGWCSMLLSVYGAHFGTSLGEYHAIFVHGTYWAGVIWCAGGIGDAWRAVKRTGGF